MLVPVQGSPRGPVWWWPWNQGAAQGGKPGESWQPHAALADPTCFPPQNPSRNPMGTLGAVSGRAGSCYSVNDDHVGHAFRKWPYLLPFQLLKAILPSTTQASPSPQLPWMLPVGKQPSSSLGKSSPAF